MFGTTVEVLLFDNLTWELTKRRSSSCPTCWYFEKVVDISLMNNIPHANFPIKITIWALSLGRGFAKLEDLGIAHVGDQLLRLFAERINLFGLTQGLLVRVILENAKSPF